MKRDPRLRPLSRDHQFALSLGQRAIAAAASESADTLAQTWTAIREALAGELLPHFQVEEQWLLPALRAAGEADLADRVLADHRALRELVELAGAGGAAEDLAAFGTRLREHVRFEEHEVFHTAERVLSDEALAAIEQAANAR